MERIKFLGALVSEASASLFSFLAQIEQILRRIEKRTIRLLSNLHMLNN